MDRTAYVALHREASCKVRSELDIITLPRHDRPGSRMIGTSIETHVRALVRHHDGKDSRIGPVCGTGPAIRSLRSKELKRVSANEETGPNYY